MKVKGFTLAEVLITLGIIGVVAALTAPALIQNAGNAKIGPTLQKVKSTIENANERILYDNEASNLYAVAGNNTIAYMELLSEYISGSSYNTSLMGYTNFSPMLTMYGNSTYYQIVNYYKFSFPSGATEVLLQPGTSGRYSANGSFKGEFQCMKIDINGTDTDPNKLGKDVFEFSVDYSGMVVPWYSAAYKWITGNDAKYWNYEGTNQCNEDGVGAGSIFDNNLKVIYQ